LTAGDRWAKLPFRSGQNTARAHVNKRTQSETDVSTQQSPPQADPRLPVGCAPPRRAVLARRRRKGRKRLGDAAAADSARATAGDERLRDGETRRRADYLVLPDRTAAAWIARHSLFHPEHSSAIPGSGSPASGSGRPCRHRSAAIKETWRWKRRPASLRWTSSCT